MSRRPTTASFVPYTIVYTIVVSSNSILPPGGGELPSAGAIIEVPREGAYIEPAGPVPVVFPVVESGNLASRVVASVVQFIFSSVAPYVAVPPCVVVGV